MEEGGGGHQSDIVEYIQKNKMAPAAQITEIQINTNTIKW